MSIPTTLDSLTDVIAPAPSTNQLLKYDGTNWVNSGYSLDNLTDVDLTTTPPVLDQVLKYDGTQWVPGTGSGGGNSYSAGYCYTFINSNSSFNNPNSFVETVGNIAGFYPQLFTNYPGTNVCTFVSSSTESPPNPDFEMDGTLTANSNKYLVKCNKPGKYKISFFSSSVNSGGSYYNLYKSTGANNTFAIERAALVPASTSAYNSTPMQSIVEFTVIGQKFWLGMSSQAGMA